MRLLRSVFALLLSCPALVFGDSTSAGVNLHLSVYDPMHQLVPGVHLVLRSGSTVIASADTDASGEAHFTHLQPGVYHVIASGEGFEPLETNIDVADSLSADLTLVSPQMQKESVDVRDTVAPVEQSSPANGIAPEIAKNLPSRPTTVADALPLIPGVARSPGGGLQISGAGEQRSSLLVNSADVTDPATGQFGLTVPIDSVETLNVYQTPFLAEYGRFTSGLVSVETRRGGEKWKWELNDPFPDFRIRSYHLRGIKDATPRLNLEGPLIPGKLYISEGFEYAIRKIEVYTLSFPDNQKKQEGVNSFTQFDWIASSRQLVTATVHIAPQRTQYANINYLNPEPTSPDASMRNYTVTLADHLTLGGGVLDNTLSASRFDTSVWPQGPQDLLVSPWGNSGNYFAQQQRTASRLGWSSTYSFGSLKFAGTHNVKAGAYIAGSSDQGQIQERPIDILNSANQLIENISFTGGHPYRMADAEFAFFGQDHWIVSPHLAFDLGLRTESQRLSESFRFAPRAGVAWNPLPRSTVRAGFGLFYDRVPLNVYAFSSYPNQVITTFDGAGQLTGGPFLYQNALGQVNVRYPFVFQEPAAGNFSPRSANWSVQVEQLITSNFRLRAGFLENDASGLVVLDSVAPDPVTNTGAYLLNGRGQSRYRQFEITGRLRVKGPGDLFFSYVRSQARGDLNDFSTFLGTFPAPLIRPNQYTTLPTDLPNRFLAWGTFQLPHGFRISPVFEYRNGFPYTVTDAAQNYVGIPNQNRFPNFLSVDSRFSKDIKVSPKYTVRLSVSAYNLTDHFNPEALRTNIADPAYGGFIGQHGRRYTADFDILF